MSAKPLPPPAIRQSTEYDRFLNHPKQKIMKPGHVKNLQASMREIGFIPACPVIAFEDGRNYRITAGHNRFAAARGLKIPFYYMILPKDVAESFLVSSNIQVVWNTLDTSRIYAIDGIEDYKVLMRYHALGFPINVAASLLYGQAAGSGNVGLLLKEGRFKVRDTLQIEMIASFIREFETICPAVKTRHFMESVSMFHYVKEFDPLTLHARLRANPTMLQKTANREQMLDSLQTIYNYKTNRDNKVNLVWLAKQAADERGRGRMGK